MTDNTGLAMNFNELLDISMVDKEWLLQIIEEEVVVVSGHPEHAQFEGAHLARIRRAQRISRDFDASVPALGLIMRLLDEVETLRKSQVSLNMVSWGVED